jgi:hypothetical protein
METQENRPERRGLTHQAVAGLSGSNSPNPKRRTLRFTLGLIMLISSLACGLLVYLVGTQVFHLGMRGLFIAIFSCLLFMETNMMLYYCLI